MTRTLGVWFRGQRVGTLSERDSGQLDFRYSQSWLSREASFAISHSLPLEPSTDPTLATRFFGNLLPEGIVRGALCRRLGISEDNDFAMLAAIGGDCAGALSVLVDGEAPPKPEKGLLPITRAKLDGYLRQPPAYASALDDDARLSLAGAQDKLGVAVGGKRLFLPRGMTPSTHILKLPNRDFAALPQNEALVMRLADAVGLPSSRTSLWLAASHPLLLVERYDREIDEHGVRRLHQEDFCQALGVDRRRKYEADGGPSFAACVALVRERSSSALIDTQALLSWLVFSAIVGNRDNHAKNLALLRAETGQWRLAPFYDLVCTAAYRRLTPRLAFSIGGQHDAGNLPKSAWEAEATAVDVARSHLLGLVDEMLDRVHDALPPVHDTLAEELGAAESLVPVVRSVKKGLRSIRRGLSGSSG